MARQGRYPGRPSLVYIQAATGGGTVKSGNWIPVDKRLVALLPKDRPYTDIEAYISLRVDIDNKRVGNVTGYAALWAWSRKKVRRFLKLMEKNPDGTYREQVRDRLGTGKGHPIRLVFNKLQMEGNTLGTGKGQEAPTSSNPKPLNLETKVSQVSQGVQSQAPAPHALFFNFYKRLCKPTNKEAVQAIEYFIERWEKKFKKSHKALMPEEWQHVVETILFVWDQDLGRNGDGDDVGIEESQLMVDKYFKTKFQKDCDYSILHYNSPGVKSKRFYEECY